MSLCGAEVFYAVRKTVPCRNSYPFRFRNVLAGCCDDIKVILYDNEINFQKGYHLVNGRPYYTSDDAKWEVSYCDEEGGKWEIRERYGMTFYKAI